MIQTVLSVLCHALAIKICNMEGSMFYSVTMVAVSALVKVKVVIKLCCESSWLEMFLNFSNILLYKSPEYGVQKYKQDCVQILLSSMQMCSVVGNLTSENAAGFTIQKSGIH